MEPGVFERPREDGEAQARAAQPSRQQLLLVLALFVGLFAVSFTAVALFGGGGAAHSPGEPVEERAPEVFSGAGSHSGSGEPGAQGETGVQVESMLQGESEYQGDPGSQEEVGFQDQVAFDEPPGPQGAEFRDEPLLHGQAAAQDRRIDLNAPLLALVIDDWGYGWEAASDFLALEIPITVAVIPHLPRSAEHARMAAGRGHEVLLHLPMEPQSGAWDLGDGAVTTAMSDEEIAVAVRRAWDSLPYVSGVNNHMGSKATQDERVVRAVLAVVKERGAYFLDSRTTANSLVDRVAAEMSVPFLANDRFVDLELNPARVRDAVLRAADTARRRGGAIAIGHVHRSTYQGIVAALPELRAMGVQLAYLSDVLAKVDPEWTAHAARPPESLP